MKQTQKEKHAQGQIKSHFVFELKGFDLLCLAKKDRPNQTTAVKHGVADLNPDILLRLGRQKRRKVQQARSAVWLKAIVSQKLAVDVVQEGFATNQIDIDLKIIADGLRRQLQSELVHSLAKMRKKLAGITFFPGARDIDPLALTFWIGEIPAPVQARDLLQLFRSQLLGRNLLSQSRANPQKQKKQKQNHKIENSH